jgi:hypothetical protein
MVCIHGLVTGRFREHVIAERTLVSPVERLKIDDGGVFLPLSCGVNAIIREALGTDAGGVLCQLLRPDALRVADALNPRIPLAKLQVRNIFTELCAGDALAGLKQAACAVQGIFVDHQAGAQICARAVDLLL